jgi:quercetin dioxygenase-like cupin family protein
VNYVRLFADAEGVSHFEDAAVTLTEAVYAPPAPPYSVSAREDATGVVMTTLPAGWFGDWHPSPRLQWWFQLSGELEVEVADGEKRRLGPGSIVRVEDTAGRGHTTRVIGDQPVLAVYVHLPPA